MKTNRQIERPNKEHAGYRVLLAMTSCLALWTVVFSFVALPRSGQAETDERGKALFEKRCSGCHSLDKDKEGPRLRGVFGRTSGTVPSFQYSDALKAARITWDATTIDKWLAGPEKFVPDSDMAFQVVKADERAEIIAYLKQFSTK